RGVTLERTETQGAPHRPVKDAAGYLPRPVALPRDPVVDKVTIDAGELGGDLKGGIVRHASASSVRRLRRHRRRCMLGLEPIAERARTHQALFSYPGIPQVKA